VSLHGCPPYDRAPGLTDDSTAAGGEYHRPPMVRKCAMRITRST
jgi:hypothetical protein